MQVPIACSLTPDLARDRIAEWRELFGSDVLEVDLGESIARVRLRDGQDVLTRAVDLAEREQECCPFFGFGIELLSGQRWLRISVPQGAEAVLADVVSLLPEALRPGGPARSGTIVEGR